MNKHTYPRILAIATSSRGFGYAVLEGPDTLLDWGAKEVTGSDKNAGCVKKVKELIVRHTPDVMALEDTASKDSRRAPRIRELTQQLAALAARHNVRLRLLPRTRVMRAFFSDGGGTKHAIAEIIAARFPDELGFRLPPKRKAWKSEDSRMGIFDAMALAIVHRMHS